MNVIVVIGGTQQHQSYAKKPILHHSSRNKNKEAFHFQHTQETPTSNKRNEENGYNYSKSLI